MNHIRDGGVTPEFAQAMVGLAECYPSWKLSEGTIRMYASQLGDLTLDQVKLAMRRAVAESEFPPTIAMLRKQVLSSADDAALVAWTALGNAASAAGAYAAVEVEDGAAADALETVFGSWAEFCATPDGPALALKRQEFLAAYRAAARRTIGPRRLAGLCAPGDAAPRTWRLAVDASGHLTASRDDGAPLLGSATPCGFLTTNE